MGNFGMRLGLGMGLVRAGGIITPPPSPVLRTNYALWSQDFSNGSWIKTGTVSVTPNTALAPDGTMTADTLDWSGSNANQGPYQLFPGSFPGVHTRSLWIRGATSGGQVYLVDAFLGSGSTIIDITDAWQRVFLAETPASAEGAGMWLRKSTGAPDTVYIWGAQFESGPVPTAYIPTTSAPASAP